MEQFSLFITEIVETLTYVTSTLTPMGTNYHRYNRSKYRYRPVLSLPSSVSVLDLNTLTATTNNYVILLSLSRLYSLLSV